MWMARRFWPLALGAALVCVSASTALAASPFQPERQWPQPTYHMDSPQGVATDPLGNIYVADTENDRVLKFGSMGGVEVWGDAGIGDGSFNRPAAIAVSPDGAYVYVADTGNHRVQKFSASGSHKETWGKYGGPDASGSGNKEFNTPRGIAVGGDGSVYVADTLNERIQKFDANGDFVLKWGQPGSYAGQFYDPTGIAVSPNGDIYVVENDPSNARIQQFHPDGQHVRTFSGVEPYPLRRPWGIAIDDQGNVYVADNGSMAGLVQVFTQDGALKGIWDIWRGDGDEIGTPPNTRVIMSAPTSMAMLGHGLQQHLLVCDTTNDRLREFDLYGNVASVRGSWGVAPGRFFQASGVAVDLGGNIIASSQSRDANNNGPMQLNHRVQKFAPWGELLTYEPKTALAFPMDTINGYFNQPTGVAVDVEGNVYVAEAGYHRITKLDSNLDYLTKWGELGTDGRRFNSPGGIAAGVVDGIIQVYVADTKNNRILVFNKSGGWATGEWGGAGTTSGKFKNPQGVAVGTDGKVYVADTGNNRIQYFTSKGAYLGQWGAFGNDANHFRSPQGVAVAPNGEVYVTDYGNHKVKRFTSSGKPIDSWGQWGADPGEFWNPRGIAISQVNRVYVADFNNHRIQEFKPRHPTTVKVGVEPDKTSYLGTVTVTAALWDETDTQLNGHTMKLYSSTNGSTWTQLSSQATSGGAYSFAKAISRRTHFRWVFEGDADHGSSEGRTAATCPSRLSTPSAPAAAYVGKATTITGSLRPRHISTHKLVRILAYRFDGKSYVYKFGTWLPIYDRSTYSQYKGTVKFTSKGTWRIRAYHGDDDHLPTYSGYDYVKVN